MNKLKKYIWEKANEVISKVNNDDVYAYSFLIYNDHDDPRKPVLTIGFNTLSNYQKEIINASGSEEAKWNYAFWL